MCRSHLSCNIVVLEGKEQNLTICKIAYILYLLCTAVYIIKEINVYLQTIFDTKHLKEMRNYKSTQFKILHSLR